MITLTLPAHIWRALRHAARHRARSLGRRIDTRTRAPQRTDLDALTVAELRQAEAAIDAALAAAPQK